METGYEQDIVEHLARMDLVRGRYRGAIASVRNGRGNYSILTIPLGEAEQLYKEMGGLSSGFSHEELEGFKTLLGDTERALNLISIFLDNENGKGKLTDALAGLDLQSPSDVNEYMKISLGFYNNFKEKNLNRLESILARKSVLRSEERRQEIVDGTEERRQKQRRLWA
ncbi:hypothetical protein HYX17_02905 [Candidatus Woesearchaeota archaeon]|nr:hypothetical protein [Candidatus Woesearchaeota archaeon]